MKGSYVLLIRLNSSRWIKVGWIGPLEFRKGWYAYVGSAMGGLESRINRHLSNEKKMHWHIDYLLEHGNVERVFIKESGRKEECSVAKMFSGRFGSVPKFGCSDCKCDSHLFYSRGKSDFLDLVREIGMREWA